LLAGILAGVTVFVWASISHMVLGIGEVGIKEIPNEAAVLGSIQSNIQAPGFYYFPGMGKSQSEVTEEDQKKWDEKYRTGGSGILIYSPPRGKSFNFPALLGVELLTNILAGLIAAFLVSNATGLTSFAGRTVFVGLLGLFTAFDLHASYWNWYEFPANYTLAQVADGVIGWTLAGAVLALMIKPAKA
jgi:hypothetical protein